MPLPSVRDFVARLATSQEWNRVHEVRVDSRGGLPTPGSLFFSLDWSNAKQDQDLLFNWWRVLRQSLSSLPANYFSLSFAPSSGPSVSPLSVNDCDGSTFKFKV